MRPSPFFMLLCTFAGHLIPAYAAEPDPKNRVVVIENVKLDYAQVLNVEPVYQTLRATRIEEQCESEQAVQAAAAPSEDESRINRMVDSVKEMFSRRPEPAAPAAVPPTSTRRNCKVVEVPREFRRPIAFDVDYVYKGTKYRSRLPEDPGNRLRIRVSVTPYIPDAIVAPPR
ncbi:hypothetical protein BI312_02565 [Xanthomonas citri pv. citri]|uniref:Secreted protein n=4 Tax=Xanthomonas TaxID=338 RepID=A0AAI7ZFX9_XANAC|nr:conserved hypothetical protein [Xanthomonas citri pv. citri str. 306]AGI07809.1 Hypothetical Protein XCAW_02019 [Xanthomonas citri subsp. citri Aw12879]APR10836.1 hypothetical protein BI314_12275 [Xanthomonas citri pv. citri]APR13918.1 hypothetical protein BI315_02640 [Xanthomonas citri pv. citri]APR20470.1 hypothetical protein BI316_14015 [Xanthomonas citri pv. citri]